MTGISNTIWKKLSESVYSISRRDMINIVIVAVLSAVILFIIIVTGFYYVINTIPFCIEEVTGIVILSFLVGIIAGTIIVYSHLKRFLKSEEENPPE